MTSALLRKDTIVAVATANGYAGIGVVRLSGHRAYEIAQAVTDTQLSVRHTHYATFFDGEGAVIDQGVAVYFKAPHSFTGEDVAELQGHGSPVALNLLVQRCLELGAVMAEPGEFSQRAFVNNKIDLVQAESIADLIAATTEAAARSAVNSLTGMFSERIEQLVSELTHMRIFVEAAIDFPDEEIDFLADRQVMLRLESLQQSFQTLLQQTRQGQVLRDGFKVVLTGLPNAGKSSLLNRLAQQNRAIVSAIPGTTRDTLEQYIDLDGLPVEIVDTAGIRKTDNEIEAEGIRRAIDAQSRADLVLLVLDIAETTQDALSDQLETIPASVPVLKIYNKVDQMVLPPLNDSDCFYLSALTGQGLDALVQKIQACAGYRLQESNQFIARARHLDAIKRAYQHLQLGINSLDHGAPELLAEELRHSQNALGEITGQMTSDMLLGHIFSSFCIGK